MLKKTPQTEEIVARPPVVVVMGHIDHGKSTLLDYIRKTKIAENEKGGITQHVGAYEVALTEGKKITFLDTPGHEAFRAIRSRGAKAADIAILVVAADDSVKPQTIEALKCIREEKIPFVVAINKTDKPGANIEKTKNDLAENGVFLEGFGGDVPYAEISAKTGQGIDELLDLLWLVAELEELKGDLKSPAEGFVLESNLNAKKGITATLIIKNGAMKSGDFVATIGALAPIRIMEDFLGETISTATFSSPIRIIGWSKMPKAGDIFKVFKNKKEAEAYLAQNSAEGGTKKKGVATTEDSEKILVPLIIKADTIGCVEAIEHELGKLESDGVKFKILNSGIGTVSEKDVQKAGSGQKAVIVGFNVKIDSSARNLAERDGIIIEIFDIIYKMTEWLKTDLAHHLPKVETEELTGKAKVLKIFGEQKGRQIIGGKVLEGEIQSDGLFRISRRDNLIGSGKIRELQQKKESARKVEVGNEFGAMVESRPEVTEGDVLEFYKNILKAIQI